MSIRKALGTEMSRRNVLAGFGRLMPAVGAMKPDSKARIVLINVPMLLAASLCPTFGLTCG